MTIQEFQSRAQLARARAERITNYRRTAMRQALRAAGTGDGLNVLHNALLSAEQGKPWPEIDYKAARLARFLESRMDAGHRIADAYCTRIYREVTR